MQTINGAALTNRAAMGFARRVLTNLRAGEAIATAMSNRCVPDVLSCDVRTIIGAVSQGWFLIPNGIDDSYSASQFWPLHALLANASWVQHLEAEAIVFEAARAEHAPIGGRGFGVESIPSFVDEAQAVAKRMARMPIEHRPGEITLILWVQILQDSQSKAQWIRNRMECLRPEWMWDTAQPLEIQVNRLLEYGCADLIRQFISTTRNRWIDRFETRLIDKVRRGMSVDEYERQLAAEQMRRADEAREHWKSNYQLITQAAHIFDGLASFSQGAVTRRLRAVSGGAFKLLKTTSIKQPLALVLKHNFEISQAGVDTPFLMMNFVMALCDALDGADATIYAYIDACGTALERVKAMTEPDAQAISRIGSRRPDDIDTAA